MKQTNAIVLAFLAGVFFSPLILSVTSATFGDTPINAQDPKPSISAVLPAKVKDALAPITREQGTLGRTDTSSAALVMPVKTTQAGDMVQIVITGVPDASLSEMKVWCAPDDGTSMVVGRGLNPTDPIFAMFQAKKPGTYSFYLSAAVLSGTTPHLLWTSNVLIVNGVKPPDPPVPPGPPVPPTPTKLRSIMFYDPTATGQTKLTEAQREVLNDVRPGSVRDYLTSHALVDTWPCDGTTASLPAFHWYPNNIDISGLPADLQALWKPLIDKMVTAPCIVVQQGVNGPITRIDLPADRDTALGLLQPLGGK